MHDMVCFYADSEACDGWDGQLLDLGLGVGSFFIRCGRRLC